MTWMEARIAVGIFGLFAVGLGVLGFWTAPRAAEWAEKRYTFHLFGWRWQLIMLRYVSLGLIAMGVYGVFCAVVGNVAQPN